MLLLPVALICVLVCVACASIGRPEGGPRDTFPPVFISASPADGALNVKSNRIRLRFDENITLKDVMSNVVVSPAQKEMPRITGNGHVVTVELKDTLIDSTTYTIDFGNAISDLNEGNILDGFSYAFSTGPTIDTMRISGMVFEAKTLEPAQGMMVGVYSNLSDTAIHTLPLERLTRTDQYGRFTIRNLAPGTYRIYAINDLNRDYKWDRSEDIAFHDLTITPATSLIDRVDTISARDGSDSIVTVKATQYLPNDVLLTWFNYGYASQYLAKNNRNDRNIIYLEMGTKSDSLPTLTVLDGSLAGKTDREWAVLEASATLDSLTYWIKDSTIINTDSLRVAARYLRTDTNDNLSWTTDTLRLFMRKQKSTNSDSKSKAKNNKESKDSLSGDSVAKIELMKIKINSPKPHNLGSPLVATIDVPAAEYHPEMVKLEIIEVEKSKDPNDTKETKTRRVIENFELNFTDSLKPRLLTGNLTDWKPGQTYCLTIDSAAIVSIYGVPSEKLEYEFSTKAADEYSNLTFHISGTNGHPAIVELLSTNDSPVAKAPVNAAGDAVFNFVTPGKYYARMFFDDNNNGIYDIGIVDSIQPEETAYYPKRINLKKNWDLEQSWDIYEIAIDMQKPNDIKKNKPKTKDGSTTDSEEEDEDDGFDPNDPFGSLNSTNRNGTPRSAFDTSGRSNMRTR